MKNMDKRLTVTKWRVEKGDSDRCRTVGQDRQKCKETSNPLADKQQKTGEHVENIKFS